MHTLVPLGVNGEAGLSVLDQAENDPPWFDVAAASMRTDSLFPTPTLSPLLLVSVFGKPPVVRSAPVQLVEAVKTCSVNVAVVAGGDVDVPAPGLADVVVHEDVHRLARSPVVAGERDRLSRVVILLVTD